jgi:hypothetical protein
MLLLNTRPGCFNPTCFALGYMAGALFDGCSCCLHIDLIRDGRYLIYMINLFIYLFVTHDAVRSEHRSTAHDTQSEIVQLIILNIYIYSS